MKLLQQAYNREDYLDFLNDRFNFSRSLTPVTIDNNEVESFEQLGKITTGDEKELPVFEIRIKPNTRLSRNRVQLRNLIAKEIKTEDGALAVYVDIPNNQWRFSFIAIEWQLTDEGIKEQQTASKRFTYLLGENTQTRTAKDRFRQLNQQSTLENLKEAFAVEPLNKEFYDKLYRWYEKAQKQVVFPNDEQVENHAQTSLIRLLTRLLFIWFIKEKKLINADLFDKDELQKLIHYDQPSSFYKAILQNLFFATLNNQITGRGFRTTTNGRANSTNYLAANVYRYQNYFTHSNKNDIIALFSQTPFLNGGLFECLDREASDAEKQDYDNDSNIRPVRSAIRVDGFSDSSKNEVVLDNSLFFNDEDSGLIDLFNQYQFTVEESTPLDIEVALDPELLGKVFENLLASYNPETGQQARKATGSFYTPREIVSYMVDESLKQYFKQNAGLDENEINNLFIEKENTLDDQQTKTLIHAIDNLKILDPAVGSGAYPMGILQRLVSILEKVDPGNIHFKEQQIDKAEQIQDEASRDSAIAAIEQVFSQQNQHNAYGKKLMLIENCIYGADIQPIAIQVCKLRFFISLTIEQTPNQDKRDNYGIKALPNLETRFIVANSLLPLGEMPKQAGLFDEKIKELQKQLAEVRHKHFSAKTLTTKRKHRKKDRDLREQMRNELTTESGITLKIEQSMQKIVDWDLYNQNATADWFNPEWMFGVKQGFDIVIGNPPYVQLQKDGGRLGELYEDQGFTTFARSGDIYQLFYERGLNLLTRTGLLCYITSNKWMRTSYGSKTRKLFAEKNPLILLDLGSDAFETATVDTNILLINNISTGTSQLKAKTLGKEDKLTTLTDKDFYPMSGLDETPWAIRSPQEQSIKEKIANIGTPLKEWDVSIYRGLVTGCNEAFIIDQHKRDELVAADSKSAEIIKPILRGRDIQQYGCEWAGKWVIATFPTIRINIDHYPAVKKHLLTFGKERLEQTGKKISEGQQSRKKTGNKWFETQDPTSYYNEFEKEKIIYSDIVQEPQFYLDSKGYYIETTAFLMTGESIRFLLGILHSKLATYAFRSFYAGGGLGNSGYRYKKKFLEQLPIPKISEAQQKPFTDLVDKILAAKAQDSKADTSNLEAEIDQLVYQLYDPTPEEIKIVEES